MRRRNKVMSVALFAICVIGMGLLFSFTFFIPGGSASDGGYHQGRQYPAILGTVEWIHMPAPDAGSHPEWCIVYERDGSEGDGVAMWCQTGAPQ